MNCKNFNTSDCFHKIDRSSSLDTITLNDILHFIVVVIVSFGISMFLITYLKPKKNQTIWENETEQNIESNSEKNKESDIWENLNIGLIVILGFLIGVLVARNVVPIIKQTNYKYNLYKTYGSKFLKKWGKRLNKEQIEVRDSIIREYERYGDKLDEFSKKLLTEVPYYFDFKDKEAKGEFFRVPVPSDGNCFFHSIAAVTGENNQQTIRNQLNEYLTELENPENKNDFAQLIREFGEGEIKRIRTIINSPNTYTGWADDAVINLAAHLYKANIYIVDQDGNVHGDTAVRGPKNAKKNFYILWINQAHYEPLIKL